MHHRRPSSIARPIDASRLRHDLRALGLTENCGRSGAHGIVFRARHGGNGIFRKTGGRTLAEYAKETMRLRKQTAIMEVKNMS